MLVVLVAVAWYWARSRPAFTPLAGRGAPPSTGQAHTTPSTGDAMPPAPGELVSSGMGGEWRLVVTVTRNGTELTKREIQAQAGG